MNELEKKEKKTLEVGGIVDADLIQKIKYARQNYLRLKEYVLKIAEGLELEIQTNFAEEIDLRA